MPDGEQGPGEATRRFLTFRMEERLYAIAAAGVSEVVRVPAFAHVPNGPKSLLGLANLRGAVLPIASLRGLLGQPERLTEASRTIVLEGAAPVGLAVDTVEALVSVDAGRIETRQAELAMEPGERLSGAFQAEGAEIAKILDLRALIEEAFVPRARPARPAGRAELAELAKAEADGERDKLVTFDVAGQEFALALEAVCEIVPVPDFIAGAPHSENLVLGVAAYRGALLPLLSLRGLLGLGGAPGDMGRRKVVVTAVGDVLVGLVVDQMRAIVPVDPALLEPTPAMLAARTGGEAQIKAIYRGEGGRRLISVLATDHLFREDVMERLGTAQATAPAPPSGEGGEEGRLFLVFNLGDEEFGLPIEAVDEVCRVPDQITRLPKTPAFLEGVVNLRGEVVPVIDQRQRFEMPPASDLGSRRLVIVRTERHRAGLIVDSVSEVLRSAADSIEPAPDLAGESVRLVHGVLNLEATGRLVLLLDPAELLNRAERGLLDVFRAEAEQPSA